MVMAQYYIPRTIGVDFVQRDIKGVDGITCKLRVWDVSGRERFEEYVISFFRDATGFLLVFDD